jgi:hypothetical protein
MRRLSLLPGLALVACLHDRTGPTDAPIGVNVSVDFCATGNPQWFAFRNEGQPWVFSDFQQRLHPFVASQRVTVAFGGYYPGFGTSWVTILYVTAGDLKHASCAPFGQKEVFANVLGRDTIDVVRAVVGASTGEISTSPRTRYATQIGVQGVPTGAQDLVAMLLPGTGARPTYIIHHGIDAPSGGLVEALDFPGLGVLTVRPTVQIADASAAAVHSSILTKRGTLSEIGLSSVVGGTGTYIALPQSILESGDLHKLAVRSDDGRVTTVYNASAGAASVTMWPALSAPLVETFEADSLMQMRATLAAQPDYSSFAVAAFVQGAFGERVFTVVMSGAYQAYSMEPVVLDTRLLPFLTSEAHPLRAGAPTTWRVQAWNSTAGLFFADNGAADGSVVRCAMVASDPALFERGCRSVFLHFNTPVTPPEVVP